MLRITLTFLVVFGLPFAIEATIRFIAHESWALLAFNLPMYLAALVVLFLRNRISYRVQLGGLLGIFFLWAGNLLLTWGFTGAGYYALFILPILASVLVDAKTGLWVALAGCLVIVIAWIGVSQEWVTLGQGIFSSPTSPPAWIAALGMYAVWSILIGICLYVVQKRLVDSRDEAIKTATKLKATNQTLFDEIKRREESEEELQQSQEQLQQSQRLESIGRLAGGVAHDFNNLLTSIAFSTELILRRLPERDVLRGEVAEIDKAGRRAAKLIQQLLTFSRQQIISPRVVQPNAVLDEAWKMLRRIIGEQTDLSFRPARDLGCVKADPAQIEQVLINLAVNARDAMPTGGRLTIETRNATVERDTRSTLDAIAPGPYVVISITDTGHGMDAATKAVIFEPFFTTKSRDEGTGLGLSTVYGIVKQNGGAIAVDSSPGKGSTFSVYLPRVSGKPEPAPKARALATIDGEGKETILLVEDEERVRNVARRALERHGYRVIEASDGPSAIALFEQHDAEIRLLVTDVVMPAMSGRTLYETLHAKNEVLPVLFMSGYAEDIVSKQDSLVGRWDFVQKPFNSKELAQTARALLDSITQ